MLEAVQAVHLENVVHTDLKPANFVLVKGRLKIIDFGIAKAIANDTVNIQREAQVSAQAIRADHRSVRSTTCRLKRFSG
jgi:serine/threonine protein kinase